MSTTTTTRPEPDRLARFALGRLAPEESAAIERHVQDCPQCGQTLRGVHDDTLVELARAAAATPAPVEPPSPEVPPELADHPRYRVLAKVGEGGMSWSTRPSTGSWAARWRSRRSAAS